ncbi:hypothetical protein J4465_02305 [Candidatus Pacearchaeota archaeon]|nr:hypothetical protein [Candidatus Pacearchaeota archaeon]
MEYSQEFVQQFLKVAAKSKIREKKTKILEEKRKVEGVKKELKRKANLMKKSIMLRPEIEQGENQKPYFQQEKKKIVQMSDLVIHSQKGIEKEPRNIQLMSGTPRKDIFLEKTEPIILTPKNVNSEKILEIPLPPSFKKIQSMIPMVPIAPIALVSLPDFGKIDELIRGEDISIVQCDGPNTNVKVNHGGKIEKTEIILDEQEIKNIIRKFAERAEKELTQPIFKANLGNLEITAISSDFSGNRFVITKK